MAGRDNPSDSGQGAGESRKLDAKRAARLRKRELEAQKRKLRRRERRRTWMFAGLGVLVGGAIVAAVVVQEVMAPKPFNQRPLGDFGVSLSDAQCGPVQTPKTGADTVVTAGAKTPTYDNAPPVGGPHAASGVDTSTQHFYGPTTKPEVEQLVANELNNATVIWYRPSLKSSDRTTLQQLTQRAADIKQPQIVTAPWWPAEPSLPAGKDIAFATKGHVQYCSRVSGAALNKWIDQFPDIAPTAAPPIGSNLPTTGGTPSASAGTPASPTSKATTAPSPTGSPTK